jgi:threonine/homoserine/homoserine lactone efflux protein
MLSFFLIGLVLLLAAMSPGPDFVVVTKNATLHSRRAGIWTALGIGTAVLIHATYSLAGLGFVVAHSLFAFSLIKWAGALYLSYLGIHLLLARRSAGLTHATAELFQKPLSDGQAFVQGFGTNFLNPKAIYFFVGIFAQVVSVDSPLILKVLYILEAGLVAGGWFLTLVWLLNVPGFKGALRRALRPVEKAMGALLLIFAIKLAFERA